MSSGCMPGSSCSVDYMPGASAEIRVEGTGPALILLHGLQSNLTIWDEVCGHLSGIECIRLNFPGRGHSFRGSATPCLVEEFYSISGFADLLHSLVRKLEKPVSIAGWSMGAMVTLEYIRKYGATGIESIILCSGLSKVSGVANIFRSRDDEGILREISGRSEKAGLNGSVDPVAVLNCWKSMRSFDCREMLRCVNVRALVIHGVDDAECPFDDAVLVSRMLPRSELIALEGGSHLILSERPETVAQAISRHLMLSTGNCPETC